MTSGVWNIDISAPNYVTSRGTANVSEVGATPAIDRQLEPKAVEHVIARSCQLKARVVEQDEREETGLRAILNYGHTFAHAFETAVSFHTNELCVGVHDDRRVILNSPNQVSGHRVC